MCGTMISSHTATASRDYKCMAFDWIENSDMYHYADNDDNNVFGKWSFNLDEYPLEEYEIKSILEAIESKGKIVEGERYYCSVQNFEKDIVLFRAKHELHRICQNYDLYQC